MSASSPPRPGPDLGATVSSYGTRRSKPVRREAGERHYIANRFEVLSELGRGGLAVVHRVADRLGHGELALKQLAVDREHRSYSTHAAAFEREYHTLVQLSHPRIVSVYDFGSDDRGPYYTMELLDGGDLRSLSPLPWRDACALMYDVCSSLALLHSRNLVHRDISPRNVHSTSDGCAKLIDFGALSPMGPNSLIVGTPPFVAPEVLHRSALDGRTDLFSLGATLYYALTRRLAYSARHLDALQAVWQERPPPPSAVFSEIPPALDALVLSLISLDPAARPRTAFEVMQRLATIADLQPAEDGEVSQAYLATPTVVGRDETLKGLRKHILGSRRKNGRSVLLEAEAGLGRSRLLDMCAVEARILGTTVLRVNHASGQVHSALSLGQALGTQLLQTLPERSVIAARKVGVADILFEPRQSDSGVLQLRPTPSPQQERAVFQQALSDWVLRVARRRPLVILIDDVQHADQASLALLAMLTLSARRSRVLLVSTALRGAAVEDPEAFALLQRESSAIELAPLAEQDSYSLLASLFGDVPNLALLVERVHEVAEGKPRELLDTLGSLIGDGVVRYRAGRWRLPSQLSPSQLPTASAEAFRDAVAGLGPHARMLAELHALASHPTLDRSDYACAASEVFSEQLDAAVSELLARRALVLDGEAYGMPRVEWREAVLGQLDAETRTDRHRRLAEVYADNPRLAVERAEQLLLCGEGQACLDLLMELVGTVAQDAEGLLSLTEMPPQQLAALLDRALTVAEQLEAAPRTLQILRVSMAAVSVVSDEVHYQRVAQGLRAQLERDSGLEAYWALDEGTEPGQRLSQALTQTMERYQALPEAERVMDVQEAIRGVAYYVALSIAVGVRMQDAGLITSLPRMLEPFAPLSTMLHALWQNALATCEASCDSRPEQGLKRWRDVLDSLSQVSQEELPYVAPLRSAIFFGIGSIESRMGMRKVEETAQLLEDDPMQAASAMSLRQVARLQQGDLAGAERYRKRAERIALQSNRRSMFTSTLQTELLAYALASDLTGIEQATHAIQPLAARFPGWQGYQHLGEGYFQQASGRLDEALAAFERGLEVSAPKPRQTGLSCSAWPRLLGAVLEVLVSLDRAEEAKTRGEQGLARCAEHQIDASAFAIRRALALAEAKLGDYEAAGRRLESVIEDMIAIDSGGLELGTTYEARARIAIWFQDHAAVTTYGQKAAQEYRYGEGSSLGARYERLMDEARHQGGAALPQLVDFQSRVVTSATQTMSARALVDRRMRDASSARERADTAAQLICEALGSNAGHLYLYTGRALAHAASVGKQVRDPQVDTRAQRCFAEANEVADQTTRTVAPSEGPSATTDGFSISPSELRDSAVALFTDLDGDRQCIGVAVVVAPPGLTVATTGPERILSGVANVLLRAGDACAATEPS